MSLPATPSLANDVRVLNRRDAYSVLALALLTLAIGVYRVGETGPMWPDDPRYANAGAMVHDWLRSGDWLHPYAFAQRNYAQYPGFSVPYHPPGYPGMLGVYFLLTGVGHVAARMFVTLCATMAAVFFYALARRQGLDRIAALLASALLATTPEIIRWQRSTMSEIPGLALLLLASYWLWRWYESDGPRYCWAASGAALLAVLCRVTTVGVVPGWLLFIVLTQRDRLRSPHLLAAGACYVLGVAAFVLVAARFGSHEVWADGRDDGFDWHTLGFWPSYFFYGVRWGTSWIAIAGVAIAWRSRPLSPATMFWLCWFASFAAFKLIVPTAFELRHGFYIVPALAGLAGPCVARVEKSLAIKFLVSVALVANVSYLTRVPLGILGFDQLAASLAEHAEPGNVLVCCWHDAELMFRFRSLAPNSERTMLRGDRTLSVRTPRYADKPTKRRARTTSDVPRMMRAGRARYLVTCEPDSDSSLHRAADMELAHRAAIESPESFRLLDRFPLSVHYQAERHGGTLYLWEYLSELPSGPSELPIEIPTAGLKL